MIYFYDDVVINYLLVEILIFNVIIVKVLGVVIVLFCDINNILCGVEF